MWVVEILSLLKLRGNFSTIMNAARLAGVDGRSKVIIIFCLPLDSLKEAGNVEYTWKGKWN